MQSAAKPVHPLSKYRVHTFDMSAFCDLNLAFDLLTTSLPFRILAT